MGEMADYTLDSGPYSHIWSGREYQKRAMNMKVFVKDVRMAFASIFKATTVNGEGEPAYSAQFIVPPTSPNVKTLDAALLETATQKWGDQGPGILKELIKRGRVCFIHDAKRNPSGDPYDGFEGNFSMSARARQEARPMTIGRAREVLVEADGVLYGGCYVNAQVELWAQDNQYGKRVNAQLLGVQFVRDGDAFTGGSRVRAEDFEDLSDEAEDGVDDLM